MVNYSKAHSARSMGAATYIAVVMALLTVTLVGAGLWYYFDKMPSATPTNLKAILQSSDNNGTYTYKFTWQDDTKGEVVYQAYVYQGSAVVARTQTSNTYWTPTQGFPSGAYTLKVTAVAGKRPPSPEAVLNFSAGSSAGGDLPEAYVISPVGGGYLFTKGKACTATTDCASGQTCTGGYCYYTDNAVISYGAQACNLLGGSLATEDQVYQAFSRGGDWCSYGVTLVPPQNTAKYIYPSYNPGGGCGLSSDDTPTVVTGGTSQNTNVTCYGVKPAYGTKVNVLGTKDGQVTYDFSANLGLWSEYSPWDGKSKYGCTEPGETCTNGDELPMKCGCDVSSRVDVSHRVKNWPKSGSCKWDGSSTGCKALQNDACDAAGFCFDSKTKGSPWCYACG